MYVFWEQDNSFVMVDYQVENIRLALHVVLLGCQLNESSIDNRGFVLHLLFFLR